MESAVVKKKHWLKELTAQRSYMILLTANAISRFGDSVDSIAYEWMVYVLTGSKLLMGALLSVNALPNILFGVFTGVLADRYSKKKIFITGNTGRGIMVSITAFLYLTGILKPWHLFVITFINSTFESLASPAQRSLLPMVLPREYMLSGNSFSGSVSTFAELIGLGAAGVIIATLGISGAIFVDAFTFFAACLLVGFIKLDETFASSKSFTFNDYMDNLKEGFSFVRKNTLIFLSIIMGALTNFCLSPFNVLQPAYVKDILKTGAEGMSCMGLGFMSGMILGGLLVGQFGSKFKKSRLIISGFFTLGLCYTLLSIPGMVSLFIPPVVLTVAICFVFGISLPFASAPLNSYVLESTPQGMLGRVTAFLGMLCMCALPAGCALTGVVSQYISIPVLFIIMGGIIMLASIMLIFQKDFRSI